MPFLHRARCLLFANTHTHTRHTAQPHIISLLIIIGTHDMDGNGLDGGAVVILLRITNEYVNVSGICMVLVQISPCIYSVYSLLLNISWPFCFCFCFSFFPGTILSEKSFGARSLTRCACRSDKSLNIICFFRPNFTVFHCCNWPRR